MSPPDEQQSRIGKGTSRRQWQSCDLSKYNKFIVTYKFITFKNVVIPKYAESSLSRIALEALSAITLANCLIPMIGTLVERKEEEENEEI